jgi:hypothetical protein
MFLSLILARNLTTIPKQYTEVSQQEVNLSQHKKEFLSIHAG